MSAAMIPPASAHPTRAGAGGTTHPNSRKGAPVLACLTRRWADPYLAAANRRLANDRSYLAGELERVTRERDDARAELEQWRNGNPRHIALTHARRGR